MLEHSAPLHAESLLAFLAARAVPGVEEVAGGAYRRSLRLPHGPAVVELRPEPRGGVRCRLELADERDAPEAERRCRHLLDLDAAPREADGALARDPLLRDLVAAAPGRRVPGTVDAEELAVRAVLGQQVSVRAAVRLAERLVAAHGERLPEASGAVTHLFPSPAALSRIDPAALPMPRARATALVGLAAALDGGLAPGPGLAALPGIGPWTAGYVAMRAGDRDVLLAGDAGVRRALRRLGRPDAPAWLECRAERWRPFRSYGLAHLWSVA
jgi:AraC family transcriptional regulator of adaptative response / DNA-3-methyladenine glycosylase II